MLFRSGSGFRAGEAVDFVFHSDPVALGQLVSADGTVSFKTVVPETADFGAHDYTGTGLGSGLVQTAAFQVLDPDAPVTPTDPGTDPGTPGPGTGAGNGTTTPAGAVTGSAAASSADRLAATGMQLTGWLLTASVLIAGGLVFVMHRRRARAAAGE